jgi:DNA-binding transcriptional regulator LsrR (DeoR family)
MESMKRLLYRIAQAYYEEDLTQAEIAERFGISRIKVSRLLTRAREEGVVRITVVPPQEGDAELERQLEERFGLDEAIVAEPDSGTYPDVVDAVGKAAAQYVVRVLEDGQTLGVTWGNSILATVMALPSASLPECRTVQLLGGLGELEAEIHGAELVRRAAERLGCRPRNIHAPGIVASRAVRDALVADPQVADTLELGRTADVALLGIGALGPHSVLRGHGSVLSEADCAELLEMGVVGDIALRFFNADGEPVMTPYTDRTIGVSLEDLASMGKRVGIAGGREKEAAVLAALNGRHVNVLVTDARTARAVLSGSGAKTTNRR